MFLGSKILSKTTSAYCVAAPANIKRIDHTVSDEVEEAGDEFDEVDDKELVPIETALILSLSLTLFALFFVTTPVVVVT